MNEKSRIKGITGDIVIHKNDKGGVTRVTLGDLIFTSRIEVSLKQKETHQQLMLMADSIKATGTGNVLNLLVEEAKLLQNRLTDLTQIKDLYPRQMRRRK